MFDHLTLAQRSELWFALPLVGVLPLVLSLFGMPWDEGVLVFGICAVPLAYLALALAAIVRKVAEPTRSELIALFLCAVVTPALMKAMGGLPLDEVLLPQLLRTAERRRDSCSSCRVEGTGRCALAPALALCARSG